MNTYEIRVQGIVQGVGFRPFIYKLAVELNVNGFVKNDEEGVYILLYCSNENFQKFLLALESNPPTLSKIYEINHKKIKNNKTYNSFKIVQSQNNNHKTTLISPDISICNECINDILDETNFRYEYPLTNCTNCGPRYSIIKTVPYDRVNTSMKDFQLCDTCKNEYENPLDRRYHAQPIACPKCGPNLTLYDKNSNIISKNSAVLKDIAKYLKDGKIIALKGMGGFHIICDAFNENAINELRIKKNRPNKPFAVMFADFEDANRHLDISKLELELLTSKEKPIVLIPKKNSSNLPKIISPDTKIIGAFLPYTPLQYLLFKYFKTPIIATSANLKGEPIIKDLDDIFSKISDIVDYVVDYNRDILNFSDDSILCEVNNKIVNIRNSRGYAPTVIKLNKKLNCKVLALGANQKSNITLAFEDKAIVSPYIGDLNSLESIDALKRTISTFERFYDFKPDIVVCDMHPNYESTKLAKELSSNLNIPLYKVQHHHAHLLATTLEYDLKEDVLGICFDGTGYGLDSNLWGGEFLLKNNNEIKRVGHFKYFKLLGGEMAIKEPRRIALALLFENYSLEEILKLDIPTTKAFSIFELKTLHKAWENSLNTTLTSSVGRVFDAIASFANLCQKQSYEGQTGALIENYYDENIKEYYDYEIKNEIIDISLMINEIVKESLKNQNKTLICTKFLNTLVQIIFEYIKKHKKTAVFCGGVFQNRTLLNLITKKLDKENMKYYFSSKVPLNDGAISLGQISYLLDKKELIH